MNPRWIAPIALLAFGVFFAGLWNYLSADRAIEPEFTDPSPVAPVPNAPDDFFGAARAERPSIARARRALVKAPGPVETFSKLLPELADQLDEASVLVRGDLARSSAALLATAQADQQAGRIIAAAAGFDLVLARSPNLAVALAGRAACLVANGDLEQAAAAYRKAVLSAPRDIGLRYNYGVVLYRLARYGEAAEQFRELVAIDPDHARAQHNLATLAQRAGRLIEARDAWLAFTRLEPDVPGGWFNLGVTWMDFDEPFEAMRCFAICTSLSPDDPAGHVNFALAHAAASDLDAAFELADDTLRRFPCHPLAMGCQASLAEAAAVQPLAAGQADAE